MPRMGKDTFCRIIVSDGAGHYAQLPKLTTTQRDALTAVEGMMIANSTTDTIQAYINSAWRNMDAQMLATYLPLTGGTLTGNLNIGGNQILTTNLMINEKDANYWRLRNAANNAYRGLFCADVFTHGNLTLNSSATAIIASPVDNTYFTLKARDNGVGAVEIARVQSAAEPWFGIGKDSDVVKATYDDKLGFYSATPVAKPTGVAVSVAGIHAALVTLGLIAA